ncbi:hypothetical protein A9199_12395 [Donghicola sp. JL3646]|nr:hypothetical protein A9199_12395 [Donghicola sp. JL3646]
MTFISYAQNYEDYILYRALKDVENGFYIDVGASWPIEDNVTKIFYDKNWNGINIEPSPEAFSALVKERNNDINISCIVSNENKPDSIIHIIDDGNSGRSTSDENYLALSDFPREMYQKISVPCRTLNSILSEVLIADQPIHFLKIDVEGFEKRVLQGLDLNIFRPWIIVLEAMLPDRQVETHSQWEYILINNRYRLVYADGLNRFYIANERAELGQCFKYPVSILDDVKQYQIVKIEEDAHRAKEEANRAKEEANRAEIAEQELFELSNNFKHLSYTNHVYYNRSIELSKRIAELEASNSWRLTSPLRWISRKLKAFPAIIKRRCFKLLKYFILFLLRYPKIVANIKVLLRNFPYFEKKSNQVYLECAILVTYHH